MQREEISGGELLFRPAAPPLCPAAFKTKSAPSVAVTGGWERFSGLLGASQLFAEPGLEQVTGGLHLPVSR